MTEEQPKPKKPSDIQCRFDAADRCEQTTEQVARQNVEAIRRNAFARGIHSPAICRKS